MAVDLVDDGDGRQTSFQRFAQDETRLRQAAFGGIDQQHHAIHHLQHAFDLAAKVGVAGRVQDVDFHASIMYRGVLGHDGDAALALEIHRIHHAVADLFVLAEGPGLAQHRVNQRGFAVIDVGNNRNISNVFSLFSHDNQATERDFKFSRLWANF